MIWCVRAGEVLRGALKRCADAGGERDGPLGPPEETTPSPGEHGGLTTGRLSEKQDSSKLNTFVNRHLVVVLFFLSYYLSLMPSVPSCCFRETQDVTAQLCIAVQVRLYVYMIKILTVSVLWGTLYSNNTHRASFSQYQLVMPTKLTTDREY